MDNGNGYTGDKTPVYFVCIVCNVKRNKKDERFFEEEKCRFFSKAIWD